MSWCKSSCYGLIFVIIDAVGNETVVLKGIMSVCDSSMLLRNCLVVMLEYLHDECGESMVSMFGWIFIMELYDDYSLIICIWSLWRVWKICLCE